MTSSACIRPSRRHLLWLKIGMCAWNVCFTFCLRFFILMLMFISIFMEFFLESSWSNLCLLLNICKVNKKVVTLVSNLQFLQVQFFENQVCKYPKKIFSSRALKILQVVKMKSMFQNRQSLSKIYFKNSLIKLKSTKSMI